jgi:RNA polymerase sigma-70 factor, ECF subfamily
VDALLAGGDLARYPLAHATRGALLRRLGRLGEAVAAYETARALTPEGPQRRFVSARIQELSAPAR